MLIERKVLKIMIYNQLVEAHNLVCESEDYSDRTEIATDSFYDDRTKVSLDDKKIQKIHADHVIKSLEDHLSNEYTKISPERKEWLRDNMNSIDMIFDPITPSERAFLVNLKADEILKRSLAKNQKKREEITGIKDDVESIISDYSGDDENTFPPFGFPTSDEEDTIIINRDRDDLEIEKTLPPMGGSSVFDDEDSSEDDETITFQ